MSVFSHSVRVRIYSIIRFTYDVAHLQDSTGYNYSLFTDGSFSIPALSPYALLDSTQDRRTHGKASAAIVAIGPPSVWQELPIVVLCIPKVLNPSLVHQPTPPNFLHSRLRCVSLNDFARPLCTHLASTLTAKLPLPPCKLLQHRTAVLEAHIALTSSLTASTMWANNVSRGCAATLKGALRTPRTGHIATGASI